MFNHVWARRLLTNLELDSDNNRSALLPISQDVATVKVKSLCWSFIVKDFLNAISHTLIANYVAMLKRTSYFVLTIKSWAKDLLLLNFTVIGTRPIALDGTLRLLRYPENLQLHTQILQSILCLRLRKKMQLLGQVYHIKSMRKRGALSHSWWSDLQTGFGSHSWQ